MDGAQLFGLESGEEDNIHNLDQKHNYYAEELDKIKKMLD